MFSPGKRIKTIKVEKSEKMKEGKKRFISFFDEHGAEIEKNGGASGKEFRSIICMWNGSMPSSWSGKEVQIPDGHQLVGFALEVDTQGFITWIDLKSWKPPSKT